MTTIVYKKESDEITIAYDGLVHDHVWKNENYTKALVVKKKVLIAVAGEVSLLEFLERNINTAQLKKDFIKHIQGLLTNIKSDYQLLVCYRDKSYVFTSVDCWLNLENIDYYAIGSGAPFAMGAMAMGASPKEAVEKSSLFDVYTNNNVTELVYKCKIDNK